MKPEALLLHSSDELEAVLEIRPTLRENAHVYFLTQSVSGESVEKLGISHSYFDDELSDEDFKKIYSDAVELARTWYLNSEGRDLSDLEGCSFGRSLYYFINHLFCQTLKYQTFLKKILKQHETLVLTRTQDLLLSVAIKTVLNEKSPAVNYLDCKDIETLVPSPPAVYRSRDIRATFSPRPTLSDGVRFALARISQLLQSFSAKKRVLLTTAGKSSSMVQYLMRQTLGAKYVLQLNSESRKHFFRNIYFYFFPFRLGKDRRVTDLIQTLSDRLPEKGPITKDGLARILDHYIFFHFDGLLAYFQNTLSQLKKIRPELVILSADRHETNVLTALAAKKLGIKTATIPHGYPMHVLPTDYYAKGPKQVYDSAFVLSESYRDECVAAGYSPEEVRVSSLHYFYRLKQNSSKESKRTSQRSALILPPDYTDSTRLAYQKLAIQDMADCCLNLGIGEIGVKTRLEIELKNLCIRDKAFSYKGKRIAVFSGYGDLRKYAEQFDVIVGGFSSASLECLLQGFHYYAYYPPDAGIGMWDASPLNEILYVARNSKELEDNIKNHRIFRPGKNVDDLVLVTTMRTDDEFFARFTDTVLQCLDS